MAILKRRSIYLKRWGSKLQERNICYASWKIALWIKAITEAVVQAFWQLMRGKRNTWSHYDPCVYYNKLPGGKYIYLLLYVNDILITSKSRSAIDKLKKDLSFEYEIKDLGEAKKVLSMEIEWDWKSCTVSLIQKEYLNKILQKFNINSNTKSVSTPVASHFKLKAIMPSTSIE